MPPAAPAADETTPSPVDVLIKGARAVVTCDDVGTEHVGGWVAIEDRLVVASGPAGSEPEATRVIDASGCLVTPGLVNTHHHIFQNLTRSYAPSLGGNLFTWLTTLYPKWARLDEEAAYLSAWVGLAELALGGCTTTTDHLYVHPHNGGDLISAEITAGLELGVRFHPTRGSMSLSHKDGGLPPDSVVQDDETILAESERLVSKHHDPSHGAMTRLALAPCSPFSVTPELMVATAQLAEQLDVRLHTHLAEDPDEDAFCLERFGRRPLEQFEHVGWGTDRTWVAHCVFPNEAEVAKLGQWGTGVAHCPSSNMILGAGLAPIVELRAAGVPVGLGCDGSSSADSASLWTEARNAYLLGRLRGGLANGRPGVMGARDALHMATRGGAACLGRDGEIGQLSPGAVADVVLWRMEGPAFAGALSDPVEAWLRCGPLAADMTMINGEIVVEGGRLVSDQIEDRLARHRDAALRIQAD